MRNNFYLIFLLLWSRNGFSQSQIVNVYHVSKPDSSVSILGENHGAVPITVSLNAKLVNMRSTKPLPAKFVIQPSEIPTLLTVFIPDHSRYSFQYKCPYQIGVYTGQVPDTSHIYSLPFKLDATGTLPPYSTNNATVLGNAYPYFFSLLAGAAVCAARAGIVAAVGQSVAKTKGARANFIIVYHEDGSMAWYQNLQKNMALVKIGQHVAEGDTLGFLSSEKQHPPLFFDVVYPGDAFPQAVPVVFRVNNKFLRLQQR